MALPFEDAAFDLVCCQFGAMFFPDRSAAYRETKRVLRQRDASNRSERHNGIFTTPLDQCGLRAATLIDSAPPTPLTFS